MFRRQRRLLHQLRNGDVGVHVFRRNGRRVQLFVAGHGGEVGVAVLVVVEESSPYPRVHRFEESGQLPLLEVATDD